MTLYQFILLAMTTAAHIYMDEMDSKAYAMSSTSTRDRGPNLACHAHMVKDISCVRANTIATYFEVNRLVSHSMAEFRVQKPAGRHKVSIDEYLARPFT